LEFEITANLTRNWRLMFNAALPKAYSINANKESQAYYAANEENLRLIIEDGGGGFVGNQAVQGNDPGVSTATHLSNAISAWNTLQDTLANVAPGKQKRTRVPDLNLNAFTDYTFSRGFLKGFRVGAGVNYRGRQAIGYRGADSIAVDPADPDKGVIDDPSVGPYDTVDISGYTVAVATLSYTWRINRKMSLSLDFKIDNVFDYDKPVYIGTLQRPRNGDLTTPARVATPVNYFWVTPRNLTCSARLQF
jgi:hypothetical protein